MSVFVWDTLCFGVAKHGSVSFHFISFLFIWSIDEPMPSPAIDTVLVFVVYSIYDWFFSFWCSFISISRFLFWNSFCFNSLNSLFVFCFSILQMYFVFRHFASTISSLMWFRRFIFLYQIFAYNKNWTMVLIYSTFFPLMCLIFSSLISLLFPLH